MSDESREFVSGNPGRDVQRVGTARFLGEDVAKVHDPVWGVIGTLGDSQCYLGVRSKVDAVHDALAQRIHDDDLPVRLIAPAFTLGVSDGQLNGTDRMRYSLTSRELVNDSTETHLKANDMAGVITVVACDKPPVGTLAALLEHNVPALMLSDGSIHPGIDPVTGEPIDLVTAFQYAADPDPEVRARLALHACPGQGSCGGMFTYNTMQTFIGVLGMEPLHMVAPASDDDAPHEDVPRRARGAAGDDHRGRHPPRDIVTPAALRNAFVVVMAMGGSTNVVLHGPEIARAAGFDLWDDVLSQQEFNELSHRLPVLVNMRPFGDVLDGRRRRDRRRRGHRAGAARRGRARRLRAHLHRRDAWPSSSSGSTRRRPTARSCSPCARRSSPPAASACCAATSRPRAAPS